MKNVKLIDTKGKLPEVTFTVEDDANPYTLITKHVVANGGKPYKMGSSMSAYFGRFLVEQSAA